MMSDARLDAGRLKIFSDFDGTITEADTLIFLTKEFGGGEQLIEAIGRLIREGKISLREGIAAEMRSIRAPFGEAVKRLKERVRVDPGFHDLARLCAERRIPLTVLSAGFREIIDLFIGEGEFPGLEIAANSIRPDTEKGWQCVFRDKSEYGHDKTGPLREAKKQGFYVIFIGDGLSDRAPAEVADEVFAKYDLAEYCRSRGVNCHEYRIFDEVVKQLRERL
jgi:2-hydroxy-3-keto-5-methylthiopentenyl-1-phosphate phosphatase